MSDGQRGMTGWNVISLTHLSLKDEPEQRGEQTWNAEAPSE